MKIEKGKVVKIEYTLTGSDGNVIDSSKKGKPLGFIQGSGQLIVGLDRALLDKQAGDIFDVSVDPKDAYGERNENKKRTILRTQLSGVDEIEVGMQLHGQDEKGNQALFTVVSTDKESVTLDENHPLAGMTLHFNIKVVEVRDASTEERTHGHVHEEKECSN